MMSMRRTRASVPVDVEWGWEVRWDLDPVVTPNGDGVGDLRDFVRLITRTNDDPGSDSGFFAK